MAKSKASDTKVTRISASDSSTKRTSGTTKTKAKQATKKTAATKRAVADSKKGPAGSFFGYFSGAWRELKQVHWPTRRATWDLTIAVLAFSGFFVIFILLLDVAFKYLFEQLLK